MLLALLLLGANALAEDSVFGCAVLSVADLDGDGVRDIAVADEAWVRDGERKWAVWLVSGATHKQLAFHSEGYGGEEPVLSEEPFLSMDAIGDIDGDGVGDIAVGTSECRTHVLSGRSLAEVYETTWPTSWSGGIDLGPYVATGSAVLVGDLDQDGVRDLALATRGFGRRWVNVISGRTGNALLIIGRPESADTSDFGGDDGAFGEAICGIGDCDRDGVPDLAISAPEAHMYDGIVYFVSGRTGEILHEVRGDPTDVHLGCALSLADDVDHDGCPDLLVGMGWNGWMRSRSGVYVLSGRTGAILGTLSRHDLE